MGALAVATVAAWPGLAAAQAAPDKKHQNNFEVTPFVGYMAGGKFEDPTDNSNRDIDSDTNFGVFLNMNADSPERQYEMFYSRQSTSIQGEIPLDLSIQYLQIGGMVNFTDVQHAIPFFGMTVGATQFSPDASGLDDETRFSFTVGTGVKVPITDHIGVRFDARAFVTVMNSDSDFFCVSTEGSGTCRIRVSGGTLVQYSAMLGVIAAF